MGKSFELLGMMAFQIFLAMIVGVGLMASIPKEETIETLTPIIVETFLYDLSDTITGKKEGMDTYSVTEYLMEHLASSGSYKTLLSYDAPGFDDREEEINMGKLDYISNILQGLQGIDGHEMSLHIEDISVAENGKEATVLFNSYEKGRMALPQVSGGTKKIPMTGTSFCTQTIILNEDSVLQLKAAECTTNISFNEY